MYVDVELISNNTYQNSTFTYQVPNKIKTKLMLDLLLLCHLEIKITKQ